MGNFSSNEERDFFDLYVLHKFVGRFSLTHPYAFNYAFGCSTCGQIIAKRFVAQNKNWIFNSVSSCPICVELHPKVRENAANYQLISFRLPIEIEKGFCPIEILAEEFLFNYPIFASEYSKDECAKLKSNQRSGDVAGNFSETFSGAELGVVDSWS